MSPCAALHWAAAQLSGASAGMPPARSYRRTQGSPGPPPPEGSPQSLLRLAQCPPRPNVDMPFHVHAHTTEPHTTTHKSHTYAHTHTYAHAYCTHTPVSMQGRTNMRTDTQPTDSSIVSYLRTELLRTFCTKLSSLLLMAISPITANPPRCHAVWHEICIF